MRGNAVSVIDMLLKVVKLYPRPPGINEAAVGRATELVVLDDAMGPRLPEV